MQVSIVTLTYTLIVTHVIGECFSVDDLMYGVDPWMHHYRSWKKGQPCRTPNDESSYCVSLFTCPVLLLALGSLQPIALDFVKKSLCEPHPEDVIVCCGTMGNYSDLLKPDVQNETVKPTTQTPHKLTTQTQIKLTTQTQMKPTTQTQTQIKPTSQTPLKSTTQTRIKPTTHAPVTDQIPKRNFHNNKLLPDRRYCGFQHNDDRFNFDNSTALDEFPWLVHIQFLDEEDEDPDAFLDRCNGVLISNRYVLTTEYCGTYAKYVKLGQYNTNKTVTCLSNSPLEECTEPIVNVPVEEEIHRLNVSNGWHDFALLRLSRKIPFSDFVRPICLPLDDSEVVTRSELLFSGWGATNDSEINKKRLKYQPGDVSECIKLDDKGLGNATSVVPVCLLPKDFNGALACSGDESGPLLYSTKRFQWFVDSLITRVYSKLTDLHLCSDELPITGIKITMDVVEWIVKNMHQ